MKHLFCFSKTFFTNPINVFVINSKIRKNFSYCSYSDFSQLVFFIKISFLLCRRMNWLPWKQKKNYTINIHLMCNIFVWMLKFHPNPFSVIVFHVGCHYIYFDRVTCLPLRQFWNTTTDNTSILHREDFGIIILIWRLTLTSDTKFHGMLLDLKRSCQGYSYYEHTVKPV